VQTKNIVSPEDQKVTFVELFFDLVFVFCVTQIVSILHNGVDTKSVGQVVLVFWLVWWAWTQFTWALNAADTTHSIVAMATLLATGITFFMAVAVPDAFKERALWFAVPYVLVRLTGLGLYGWVASASPSQKDAVRGFALLSMGGLVTVILGAIVGDTLQYVFWGATILLDVVAANYGGQSEGWDLHSDHFGERHGLFVIIALGETLIVAAGGLTGAEWSTELLLVAVLAVAITSAMWWSYFTRAKAMLDHALESSKGATLAMMARDVFSLIHFPMLCGIIAYAVAIEAAVAHPYDPLQREVLGALAAGVLLFVGGTALAIWRATRQVWMPRIVLSVITALLIVAIGGVSPLISMGIALLGVVTIAIVEHRGEQAHMH
jgi:low temperature requirement protein LtrA